MGFCKSGAGMDVKYLCSWDYRVGKLRNVAFLTRPHMPCAWCFSCSQSQWQSQEQKGQIFNRGAPPWQGSPGCNKDQILPADPGTIHVNEIQLSFGRRVRDADCSAVVFTPPAGHGTWNPAETPGRKQIPISGLGGQLGNQLLLIHVL